MTFQFSTHFFPTCSILPIRHMLTVRNLQKSVLLTRLTVSMGIIYDTLSLRRLEKKTKNISASNQAFILCFWNYTARTWAVRFLSSWLAVVFLSCTCCDGAFVSWSSQVHEWGFLSLAHFSTLLQKCGGGADFPEGWLGSAVTFGPSASLFSTLTRDHSS